MGVAAQIPPPIDIRLLRTMDITGTPSSPDSVPTDAKPKHRTPLLRKNVMAGKGTDAAAVAV
jgi:hypothetical protein